MSVSAAYIFGKRQVFARDDAPNVLFWTSDLMVDADGSPRAYGPGGTQPLDFLANAGSSGNWWGIYAPDGEPHVQGDGDPYPGYYVSTVSLEDHTFPPQDPRHWTDSEKVPFFVLPSNPGPHLGAKLGDLGYSFNLDNGQSSWWIFADSGPGFKLGEGSIKLHENLGLIPTNWPLQRFVRQGGTDTECIVSILFRNSALGWPRPEDELLAAAEKRFEDWGGLSALKGVMSRLDWSKF
jgi:hypothetical protein